MQHLPLEPGMALIHNLVSRCNSFKADDPFGPYCEARPLSGATAVVRTLEEWRICGRSLL